MKFNHDDALELAEAAAMVIATHRYLVIATADQDNQPWAVPVQQVPLADGRLTWLSSKSARHSQNIVLNAKTSGTLFSVSVVDGEVSLFLEGTSQVIEDEIDLKNVINERHGTSTHHRPTVEELTGDAEYRFYSFTPTAIWINDETHTKTEVKLNLLRS
jgi:hypothetical protein